MVGRHTAVNKKTKFLLFWSLQSLGENPQYQVKKLCMQTHKHFSIHTHLYIWVFTRTILLPTYTQIKMGALEDNSRGKQLKRDAWWRKYSG